MADYTVVNLIGDVENMAPKFGMEGIEARFARTNLGLGQSGLSHFKLDPNMRMPFGHRHFEQEEIYLVLSGQLIVKVEDATVEIGPMDAIRVPKGVARSFGAGPQGAVIVAYGAPDTDNKDVEMAEIDWS